MTLWAAFKRIYAGVHNSVQSLIRDGVEVGAKATLEGKGREVIKQGKQKADSKVRGKLKGLLKR